MTFSEPQKNEAAFSVAVHYCCLVTNYILRIDDIIRVAKVVVGGLPNAAGEEV